MHFLDLKYDVLLRAFTFLDVASLLRCARVCSAFQKLAQSKHVWLVVIHSLACRNLLSLPVPATLLAFSPAQIMDEVKRAVFGPSTWAPTPVVRQQIHVSICAPAPSEPTLLLDDRHLLVKRGSGCEIWDIAENRQVWARAGLCGARCSLTLFSTALPSKFQLRCGVGPLRVMATNPPRIDCKILVQRLVLDLETDSEILLHPVRLPRNFTQFRDVVAAGDFWAAHVAWFAQSCGWQSGVLIIDWKNHTFVLFYCELFHKKFLPGHLLALTRDAEASNVVLYSWAAFTPHWQLSTTVTLARASQSVVKIQPIVLQQVEYFVLSGYPTPLMSVHECPLNDASWVVSTHSASITTLSADSEAHRLPSMHRYRLTLVPTSSGSVPRWEKIASAGAINEMFMHSLTYSGYGLGILPFGSHLPALQIVCRPATDPDGTWAVPLPPLKIGGTCLSPNTGGLTICSTGGADVYYYE
ncbi:hypothetical protein C8R45DRAFT_1101905 [Mycena sanguinolenta]|nr:hypothetical protein C8R45DRAFT_1101905 [Mycena sanguinolenta]